MLLSCCTPRLDRREVHRFENESYPIFSHDCLEAFTAIPFRQMPDQALSIDLGLLPLSRCQPLDDRIMHLTPKKWLTVNSKLPIHCLKLKLFTN